jgi:lipoprotein-anchoring transpeptidase ErfK/SrfK
MRIPIAAAVLLALTACGMNGTDRYEDERKPAASGNGADEMASRDPAEGELVEVDIPDPEQRPEMQLQVVLDRRGFGPGVIDGAMGLSTENALKGFQEANDLDVTGELDDATREALAAWDNIPATRVVRIPESWGRIAFREVPEEPEDQAEMQTLGYESLDEKLAERFHTTVAVLQTLNPDGRPAGAAAGSAEEPDTTAPARASADPSAAAGSAPPAIFRAGQLVRVPNIGADRIEPGIADDEGWQRTLASLGVGTDQPKVARVVVDKSESWLKGYDDQGKLVAMFTVTSGSSHDPLPLGEWKILGVSRNPPFHYNPDLFWDAEATDEKETLPPGPNGPVGVVWIDLSKEHYGIHGTPAPETIGRAESHGCVRLTNWDVARLAGMVSGSTKVVFQA